VDVRLKTNPAGSAGATGLHQGISGSDWPLASFEPDEIRVVAKGRHFKATPSGEFRPCLRACGIAGRSVAPSLRLTRLYAGTGDLRHKKPARGAGCGYGFECLNGAAGAKV
jgi:hypothetical protein